MIFENFSGLIRVSVRTEPEKNRYVVRVVCSLFQQSGRGTSPNEARFILIWQRGGGRDHTWRINASTIQQHAAIRGITRCTAVISVRPSVMARGKHGCQDNGGFAPAHNSRPSLERSLWVAQNAFSGHVYLLKVFECRLCRATSSAVDRRVTTMILYALCHRWGPLSPIGTVLHTLTHNWFWRDNVL